MHVLGQFRALDRPDAFVWIRGFPDMEHRRESLTAFYCGPVWAEHGKAANAMMIDSDDVHLLEPVEGSPGLAELIGPRPPLGHTSDDESEIHAVICQLRVEDTASYLQHCGDHLAALQTLHRPNTFPQLPVHEDVHVVVTLAGDSKAVSDEPDALATGPVQRLRLRPTPRSALR